MATCDKYYALIRGLGLIGATIWPWDHFEPPELYNPSLTPNFEIQNNNFNFNRIEVPDLNSRSLHFDSIQIPQIKGTTDWCR
jgi:hypothetical protein